MASSMWAATDGVCHQHSISTRQHRVTGFWKRALRDEGASSDEVRNYADAFEHLEAKALKLGQAG